VGAAQSGRAGHLRTLKKLLLHLPPKVGILSFLSSTGKWPQTDTELREFAQSILRECLHEAVRSLAPVISESVRGRVRFRFVAQGWWPFILLQALQDPRQRLPSNGQRCLQDGRRIPVGRLVRNARYCSSRCQERAKKRRYRQKLMRLKKKTSRAPWAG
jgi:hypothetical protein